MWQGINLILWLAMVGVTFAPGADGAERWIAVAGLVVAAAWQHASSRGFLRPNGGSDSATPAAR